MPPVLVVVLDAGGHPALVERKEVAGRLSVRVVADLLHRAGLGPPPDHMAVENAVLPFARLDRLAVLRPLLVASVPLVALPDVADGLDPAAGEKLLVRVPSEGIALDLPVERDPRMAHVLAVPPLLRRERGLALLSEDAEFDGVVPLHPRLEVRHHVRLECVLLKRIAAPARAAVGRHEREELAVPERHFLGQGAVMLPIAKRILREIPVVIVAQQAPGRSVLAPMRVDDPAHGDLSGPAPVRADLLAHVVDDDAVSHVGPVRQLRHRVRINRRILRHVLRECDEDVLRVPVEERIDLRPLCGLDRLVELVVVLRDLDRAGDEPVDGELFLLGVLVLADLLDVLHHVGGIDVGTVLCEKPPDLLRPPRSDRIEDGACPAPGVVIPDDVAPQLDARVRVPHLRVLRAPPGRQHFPAIGRGVLEAGIVHVPVRAVGAKDRPGADTDRLEDVGALVEPLLVLKLPGAVVSDGPCGLGIPAVVPRPFHRFRPNDGDLRCAPPEGVLEHFPRVHVREVRSPLEDGKRIPKRTPEAVKRNDPDGDLPVEVVPLVETYAAEDARVGELRDVMRGVERPRDRVEAYAALCPSSPGFALTCSFSRVRLVSICRCVNMGPYFSADMSQVFKKLVSEGRIVFAFLIDELLK